MGLVLYGFVLHEMYDNYEFFKSCEWNIVFAVYITFGLLLYHHIINAWYLAKEEA